MTNQINQLNQEMLANKEKINSLKTAECITELLNITSFIEDVKNEMPTMPEAFMQYSADELNLSLFKFKTAMHAYYSQLPEVKK